MLLKYGNEGEHVRLLQRGLNEILNLNMVCDSNFGKVTEENLRFYQKNNGLTVNGVYDTDSSNSLSRLIKSKYIDKTFVKEFAEKNNLDPAMLLAFYEVESSGRGFTDSGKISLLFERHHFYKHLRSKSVDLCEQTKTSYPNICNPTRGGYIGKEEENKRLEFAISINKEAALMSASYGLFQIMGSNFRACGAPNVEWFYNDLNVSEKNQLTSVVNFIKHDPSLLLAIKQKNFIKIATIYNGPSFKDFDYDKKLKKAYERNLK